MIPFLIQPWKHQLEAIRRAESVTNFALLFEMGAGKTATAINILRSFYVTKKRVARTLVLCPPIVIENWKREFFLHSKVGPAVALLEGTGKKRLEIFRRGDAKIYVTNYESLLMGELYEALTSWLPEAIVYDESHKLKNLTAKRTKLAIKLADLAVYKLILTGTPVLNTPMDLFAQFRILDGGETFGRSYLNFRAQYFDDKNAGMPKSKYFPNWVLRQGSLEKLNAAIKPKSMVVKKADCLDLPPLVRQVIHVPLSKDQAKFYESMKRDFIAYVSDDKACVATLAITKALRLLQIVSGFITVEGEEGADRENITIKDNPRAAALRALLEEITPNAKVVVWACFRQDYRTVRQVCEELGIGMVEVHGDVASGKRQAAVDAFATDQAVRVFLGHPQSAGIGISLVAASYCIFYSRTFSLEDDLQAEARTYRGGSQIHSKVTRYDLVATGTIDEHVAERLATKQAIGDAVLRDIARTL